MRVRELRKQLGLSQEELGFKSNIHRTYIGAVERGEQNVSLDNTWGESQTLKSYTFRTSNYKDLLWI